jgi:adenine deaminase
MIAYVGPDQDAPRTDKTHVIDADGMVLLPGLIDGHTHMACAKSGVEEFIKYVIPGGITTVVTEVDPAGIFGADGVKHWVRAFEGQPIRILYTAHPLCGLTPAVETGALEAEQLLPYLMDPNCLGVGELYWSSLLIEGRQGERLMELASAALKLGKRIEGHTAGASGRKPQACPCLGISSCHKTFAEPPAGYRVLAIPCTASPPSSEEGHPERAFHDATAKTQFSNR